jgi:hypothetical protein
VARIAIFLDHDITVRHFVLNGVLAPLTREYDFVFVFPDGHKRVRTDPARLALPRYRTLAVPPRRAYLYRRLYHATVLRKARGARDKGVLFKFWRDSLGTVPFVKSWLTSWPLTYQLYHARTMAAIGENDELNRLLDEEKPDLILHPTVLEGLFVSDLVRAGKARRIPTVFVMNSWDNPAAKAMMVGYPDSLVVWGEQTKRHAVQHLGAREETIACLGAAQFDVYRRPPRIAPEEYRRRLDATGRRRLLLYAGSSKGLNEISHLITLEDAIERGQLEDCLVLYRPHPWRAYPEGEPDFFSRPWKHVVLDPAMEACYRASRDNPRVHVELADYEDTHVTLSAVDAVISPLSTILLEAALHGKPVAAYLPDEDMTSNKFLFTTANMAHFDDFFDRVDCLRCERPERLIEDCRGLLEKVAEPSIGERLRRQCAYFVEPTDRPYAERLGELIQGILARPARHQGAEVGA